MPSDPRTTADPSSNRVRNCAISKQAQIDTSIDRKNSWSGGLGKIGNLEIWSKSGNSGLNNIGAGLRTIAGISNTVRSGKGNLPTVIGSSADWVLDKLGLNAPAAEILKQLNPDVFNIAIGQAENIYDQVKQGKFSLKNIPHVLQDLQDLEQLTRGIFSDKSGRASKMTDHCGASPYAMDLIAFAPKYKFLFVVEFEFDNNYSGMDRNLMSFVVKSSTRPQVEFDYEDINYYNFRSKAIKQTKYNPINMKFLDDDMNQAMQFYTTYLKLMSPIANMNFPQKTSGHGFYNASAMEFGAEDKADIAPDIYGSPYSASIAPMKNEAATILRQINLYHVYRQGRLMNIYKFFNPRITNMQLDDVAMDGDVNEISLDFSYDGLFIVPGYDTSASLSEDGDYPVGALSNGYGSGVRTNGLEYNGIGELITDLGYGPGHKIDNNTLSMGATVFPDKLVTQNSDNFESIKLPKIQEVIEKSKPKIPTPESINETGKILGSIKTIVGNPDDKLTDKQLQNKYKDRDYIKDSRTGQILNRAVYSQLDITQVLSQPKVSEIKVQTSPRIEQPDGSNLRFVSKLFE